MKSNGLKIALHSNTRIQVQVSFHYIFHVIILSSNGNKSTTPTHFTYLFAGIFPVATFHRRHSILAHQSSEIPFNDIVAVPRRHMRNMAKFYNIRNVHAMRGPAKDSIFL